MSALDSKLLALIVQKIINFKPVQKIVLYGSRATGDCKETSDIDLAIFADLWNEGDIRHLKVLLNEEIPTALKFDVVLFEKINKLQLRNDILNEGKILYES